VFAQVAIRWENIFPAFADNLVQLTLVGNVWLMVREGMDIDHNIRRVANKSGIIEECVNILSNRIPAVSDELLEFNFEKHEAAVEMIEEQNINQ
jgi:hypothetical protein